MGRTACTEPQSVSLLFHASDDITRTSDTCQKGLNKI